MHSSRSSRGLHLFLAVGMALALAGCPDSPTVTVPDVVGAPQLTAKLVITAAGLTVGTVTEQPSDTVADGNVISQTPAAGQTHSQGTAVHLVIAQSTISSVSVPDLTSLSQAAAAAALSSAGLDTGTVTKQFSSSVAYNGVISQSPQAGATVAPGSSVSLTVSKGPASLLVPNVVGLSQPAASQALAAVGLRIGATGEQTSRTVPAGVIINQSPGAGTNVPADSAVTLIVSTGPASVLVPHVLGFSQSVASSLLSLMGLTVGAVGEEFSDTVPTGRVLTQDPASNSRALIGDSVDLLLSKGPAPVSIPNVVGLARSTADAALASAGLALGAVTEQYSETVPENEVLSQYPVAGADAALGDTVNLAISGGSEPVSVPNIMGITQSAAEYSLTFSGLVLGTVTEAFSATIPEGRVCAQNPVKETSVNSGSPVHITLSKGPEPVPVPNIVGLARSNAEATLVAADLRVGSATLEYSDTVPQGTVISQDPVAATSVLPNTPVDFVVSLGVEPVLAPDVVGLARAAAEAAISAGDLVVGTVTEEYSDTVPEGDVISQNPIAGASVQPGTAVNLEISKGVEPLYAPNVVGLTRTAAEAAIITGGLIVGTVTEAYHDTVPVGSVISQDPLAGTVVALGEAVDLAISAHSDFSVDRTVIRLNELAPHGWTTVENLGIGELSWTATVDSSNVILNPSSSTGNSVTLSVEVLAYDTNEHARIEIVNDRDPSDREIIDVYVPDLDQNTGTVISGGWFEMGDPWNEGQAQEQPVHSVFLSGYHMGKYLVTLAQYVEMLNWAYQRGYVTITDSPEEAITGYGHVLVGSDVYGELLVFASGSGFAMPHNEACMLSDHPIRVTWHGAAAYCNWHSEKSRLEPCYDTQTWACDFSKSGFHLPTEAQWERAAAWNGVRHRRYGFKSDNIDTTRCNYASTNPQSLYTPPYTSAIGYYDGLVEGTVNSPSTAGCYDMSGNVWEWCHDWCDYNYYEHSPITDPTGPDSGEGRAVRGGSYNSPASECRTALRYARSPELEFGFRIALAFPARTTTPDLDGQPQSAWEALLDAQHLILGPVTEAYSDTMPIGEIISQNPPAGTEVAWGRAVEIVVSSRAKPGQMVSVPAGSFPMGDPWSEGEPDERPVHTVTLSAYEIGMFHVTLKEYADALNWADAQGYASVVSQPDDMQYVVGYNEYLMINPYQYRIRHSSEGFAVVSPEPSDISDHPADVPWHGAAAYCNWLSEMHGLQPCYNTNTWACDFTKTGYHLPTEAQWERAAAWDGSRHWRYGFMSDDIDETRCHYDGSNPQGIFGTMRTSSVGYYNGFTGDTVDSPSPVGCYDMSGNFRQWCNDFYSDDYYASSPTFNPTGPESGGAHPIYVIRGGTYFDSAAECRTAARCGGHYSIAGFRIARTTQQP